MKKLLALLALCVFSSSIFGYTGTIKNNSDGQAKVKIKIAVGPDQEVLLNAGETKKADLGGWCTSILEIHAISGSGKGKPLWIYEPPLTGFGIACRGWSITLKNMEESGRLFAEEN
jgi:hypothetical protein